MIGPASRTRACAPSLLAPTVVAAALVTAPAPGTAAEVVRLTQTACQFLEPEGVDRAYRSTDKATCDAINANTGADRLAHATVLELGPGTYVFRITNRDVPYELGFWLRDRDYDWRNPVHKLTKTSVSGGGLIEGKTQDYEVTLKPGEYLYSCPLNTTPDYRLVVRGE